MTAALPPIWATPDDFHADVVSALSRVKRRSDEHRVWDVVADVGVARFGVSWRKGGRFDLDRSGDVHWIIPAIDDFGDITDIVACNPGNGGRFGSYLGRVSVLDRGAEHAAAYGEAVYIYRQPWDWFVSDQPALCVVDRSRAWSVLRDFKAFIPEDARHADEVAALRVPKVEPADFFLPQRRAA